MHFISSGNIFRALRTHSISYFHQIGGLIWNLSLKMGDLIERKTYRRGGFNRALRYLRNKMKLKIAHTRCAGRKSFYHESNHAFCTFTAISFQCHKFLSNKVVKSLMKEHKNSDETTYNCARSKSGLTNYYTGQKYFSAGKKFLSQ